MVVVCTTIFLYLNNVTNTYEYIFIPPVEIGNLLKKDHNKSTVNRRSCMKRLLTVDEAKEVHM